MKIGTWVLFISTILIGWVVILTCKNEWIRLSVYIASIIHTWVVSDDLNFSTVDTKLDINIGTTKKGLNYDS
jgi:hypothetical protein